MLRPLRHVRRVKAGRRAATSMMAVVVAVAVGGGPTEQLDGVVKWYDPARGFGFVLPSDGGKDVFVHVTALRRAGIDDLQPGQNVRMEVSEARRGREAASIELLG